MVSSPSREHFPFEQLGLSVRYNALHWLAFKLADVGAGFPCDRREVLQMSPNVHDDLMLTEVISLCVVKES
jgi:hypothetical protein